LLSVQADDELKADSDAADTAGFNFNLPRGRGRGRPSPSAPSSPSKSSASVGGYASLTRGIFSAGNSPQRPAYNKERCKTLLVIDEPHVDWSELYIILSYMLILELCCFIPQTGLHQRRLSLIIEFKHVL